MLMRSRQLIGHIRSAIQQQFSGVDVGFQYLAILCIGFLPPWIMLTNMKALQVPLIGIAGFIILRYAMRQRYRVDLRDYLFSRAGILSVACVVYFAVHTFIFQKFAAAPIESAQGYAIVLFCISMVPVVSYISKTSNEPYQLGIGVALIVGLLVLVCVLSLVCILGQWQLFQFGARAGSEISDFVLPVRRIGRALEVASVIMLAVAVLFPQRYSKIFFLCSIVWLFVVSLCAVGTLGTEPEQLVALRSEALVLGLCVSFFVYYVSTFYPTGASRTFAVILVVLFLTAPWIYHLALSFLSTYGDALAPTLTRRFEIWDATCQQIFSAPFFGSGIGSFRHSTGLGFDIPIVHPHNGILELWHDIGFVGVVLITGLIKLAYDHVLNLPNDAKPTLNAASAMVLTLVVSTHSIWHTWFLSLLFMFVVIGLVVSSQRLKFSEYFGLSENLSQTGESDLKLGDWKDGTTFFVGALIGLSAVVFVLHDPVARVVTPFVKLSPDYSVAVTSKYLTVRESSDYLELRDDLASERGWLLVSLRSKQAAPKWLRLSVRKEDKTNWSQLQISYKNDTPGPAAIYRFDPASGKLFQVGKQTTAMIKVGDGGQTWDFTIALNAPSNLRRISAILLPTIRAKNAIGTLNVKEISFADRDLWGSSD